MARDDYSILNFQCRLYFRQYACYLQTLAQTLVRAFAVAHLEKRAIALQEEHRGTVRRRFLLVVDLSKLPGFAGWRGLSKLSFQELLSLVTGGPDFFGGDFLLSFCFMRVALAWSISTFWSGNGALGRSILAFSLKIDLPCGACSHFVSKSISRVELPHIFSRNRASRGACSLFVSNRVLTAFSC